MTTTEHHSYSELLHEVQPRPIRTRAEYRRMLGWLEHLMSFPATRDVSAMVELLSITIGAYEAQEFPIVDAAPNIVLDHLIESSGRTSAAIARELHMSPATLSNYRCGRRPLTVASITRLAEYFGVDPRVFLGQAKPESERSTQREAPETLDRKVVRALEELGGESVSAAQLVKHLGAPPQRLRSALTRLLEKGWVRLEGRARTARYSLVG